VSCVVASSTASVLKRNLLATWTQAVTVVHCDYSGTHKGGCMFGGLSLLLKVLVDLVDPVLLLRTSGTPAHTADGYTGKARK